MQIHEKSKTKLIKAKVNIGRSNRFPIIPSEIKTYDELISVCTHNSHRMAAKPGTSVCKSPAKMKSFFVRDRHSKKISTFEIPFQFVVVVPFN